MCYISCAKRLYLVLEYSSTWGVSTSCREKTLERLQTNYTPYFSQPTTGTCTFVFFLGRVMSSSRDITRIRTSRAIPSCANTEILTSYGILGREPLLQRKLWSIMTPVFHSLLFRLFPCSSFFVFEGFTPREGCTPVLGRVAGRGYQLLDRQYT